MKKILIALIMFCMLAPVAWGAEITKTFAWDEPADLDIITRWELYYGINQGGPYEKVTDIPKVAGQTVFKAEATATITGPPGTTQTRHFVLIACGNIQEGEESVFKCSENSNEISLSIDIPSLQLSVPVNFRIVQE